MTSEAPAPLLPRSRGGGAPGRLGAGAVGRAVRLIARQGATPVSPGAGKIGA